MLLPAMFERGSDDVSYQVYMYVCGRGSGGLEEIALKVSGSDHVAPLLTSYFQG